MTRVPDGLGDVPWTFQPVTPEQVVRALGVRAATVATCESLTAGACVARLVTVPGASKVVRGGLVTYASDLKVELAGVDADWVARHGVINPTTASQMASGVRVRCGADYGISCTGVAGPDPQDGHSPGEVWIALADADGAQVRRLHLLGDRGQVRHATVDAMLSLLASRLDN